MIISSVIFQLPFLSFAGQNLIINKPPWRPNKTTYLGIYQQVVPKDLAAKINLLSRPSINFQTVLTCLHDNPFTTPVVFRKPLQKLKKYHFNKTHSTETTIFISLNYDTTYLRNSKKT